MNTVEYYAVHVSTQLNDQLRNRAFTRWGRGILLGYLNLGLLEIGIYKPDAFTKSVDLDLVAGDKQQVDETIDLLSIDANADGSKITNANSDLLTQFSAYAKCAPSLKMVNGRPVLKVQDVSIDKYNPRVFYVYPPVPNGVPMKVRATIVDSPPQYAMKDWTKPVKIAPKFTNSIIDFMMAKAYELNRETSPADRANSLQYYQKFYDGLGVKRKIEDKMKSGFWNGRTGQGDPQAGRL